MKAFFFLLLLTNIVFAVLQWLFPYEQVFSRTTPIVAAENLRLLDESELTRASASPGGDRTPVNLPSAEKKLCFTLGPFKDEQFAQLVIDQFREHKLNMTSRPSQEKEYMGMMVFIDGHNSRDDAVATAETLAERGVRDYMIVNEPGKNNALSLGVFGLKKNAERRVERISAFGYPVKSEPRYRSRTIYWLDYNRQEPGELSLLVDKLKTERGISRISRACS